VVDNFYNFLEWYSNYHSYGTGAFRASHWDGCVRLVWLWSRSSITRVVVSGNGPVVPQSVEESTLWMELFPIVLATAVWGKCWTELNVIVHCDNMGTVAVVKPGYSKAALVMHLLRGLFFFVRVRFQFSLQAVYTPGVQN